MNAVVRGPARSRISGLLLFLGVPAILLTFAALNVLETEDSTFMAREKEFQLTSLMRRITAPARDGKPLDLSQIYFAAGTPTLASAALQQRIVQSVGDASGKIIETTSLDAGEDAAASSNQRVEIRASFDIDNDGLLELLHGLETGLPLVFVDKISIRRLPDDDDGKGRGMLRVDLEANARWRAPAP
jgi:hypothetical protein